MKKIFSLVLMSALVVACSPKTTESVSHKTETSTKTLSTEALQGKELYANKCGTCHKLEPIHEFSEEKWRKIIPPMAKKAKIDANQENLILTYVLEELK